jgi:hypothetical protein
MSNLWKALRDVSRDVDPTVGFEAPTHGSEDDAMLAGSTTLEDAHDPPVKSEDIVLPSPERPTLAQQDAPVRRPLSAPRARPAAPTPPAEPKERLAPLQPPLRRPPGTALQFDAPKANNVVRPPQFNRVEGPAPGPTWQLPTSAAAETSTAPTEVRPAGPPSPPAPAPAPARPRLSEILESRSPRPSDKVELPAPPAGPRSLAGLRAPGPAAVPAPAPRAYVTPGVTAGTGTGARSTNTGNGNGRPATNGIAFSPPSGLPDALKPFAPGSPNIHMDMAAMAMSPQWKPGDDDVMPTDGHKGSRRPRLRDHLPW